MDVPIVPYRSDFQLTMYVDTDFNRFFSCRLPLFLVHITSYITKHNVTYACYKIKGSKNLFYKNL